jgi:lipid II:glycine glycyltransferase (peptidoglycan interpeptide bridge formation enzyme)
MALTIVNEIEIKSWAQYVKYHPKGNIFQSPEMFEVFRQTKNHKPVFLAVVNENKKPLGILVAVIQKEHRGFLGMFSARSIIIGGPLVSQNNKEVATLLLHEYHKLIKGQAVYSQVRNVFDQIHLQNSFERAGFIYEPHLNILINLEKSEDELWKNMAGKARNKIRKAVKNGVRVKESSLEVDLEAFYQVLEEVYKRAKLPLVHYSLFKNALEGVGNCSMIKAFYAILDGKIIGGRLCLVYNDIIYDWYAGSKPDFYKYNPNDLLPWEIMKWGKENGFRTYDFGGAGKPGKPYGVRDFKLKYGGDMVEFGRYEKVHKPILMSIGKMGMKYYKYLKK